MAHCESGALQRHILPYSPSPYVALALRLHRLVSNELNPHAFFKLVNRAPYRLALWLHFLFPYVRYLYLSRLVSSAGKNARHYNSTAFLSVYLTIKTSLCSLARCTCSLQLCISK